MPDAFRTTRRVEFCDTDMAGIVHFSRFFTWMESAEHEFLRSRGLSVSMDWQGDRITFPRVNASCDFLKPAKFEDEVTISVEVGNVGRSSVTYGFRFFKGDEAIATGQITTVCCLVTATGEMSAIEVPQRIREKLEASG